MLITHDKISRQTKQEFPFNSSFQKLLYIFFWARCEQMLDCMQGHTILNLKVERFLEADKSKGNLS